MTQSALIESRQLNPNVRLLISPCRSGSTAVLTCFAQHPDVQAHYQNVKAGLREGKTEDHTIFYATAGAAKFVVDKETIGPYNLAESSLDVFPEERAISISRPVFLFRHPVATWNGWYTLGWKRFDLFEHSYVHAFQTFLHAMAVDRSAVLCITYERLVQCPEETLRVICAHWAVPYHANLLSWQNNLQPNVTIHGGADFEKSMAEGIFSQVQRSRSIEVVRRDMVIPNADVERIAASSLPEMYNQAQHCAIADLERFAKFLMSDDSSR